MMCVILLGLLHLEEQASLKNKMWDPQCDIGLKKKKTKIVLFDADYQPFFLIFFF